LSPLPPSDVHAQRWKLVAPWYGSRKDFFQGMTNCGFFQEVAELFFPGDDDGKISFFHFSN